MGERPGHKSFIQADFETVTAGLETLQRALANYESQGQGFMRSNRTSQALTEATMQLAQLLGAKGSIQRRVDAFLTLFEGLPLGVLLFDEAGRILLLNRSSEQILGLTTTGLPFESWPNEITFSKSESDATPMEVITLPFFRSLAMGEAAEQEAFCRTSARKDGFWVRLSSYPIRSNEMLSGAVCIVTDLTRETEKLLSQLKPLSAELERMRMVLQRSPEGFVAIDINGNVTDWNEAASGIFGFQRRDIMGRSLRDFIVPPSIRALFDAALGQLFEKGRAGMPLGRAEVPAVHADGHTCTVRLAVFYFAYGNQETLAAFCEDVTQKTRIDQQKNARHAVTQMLATAGSFDELAPKVVQSLTTDLDWEVGLLWLADPATRTLRCSQIWHQNSALDAFARRTQDLAITKGQGFIGSIWQNAMTSWCDDIVQLNEDPQSAVAESADLHSTVAFPVTSNGEVEAVFQLFQMDAREQDDELVSMFEGVSAQLGQFIDATRAIVAKHRLAAIVDASEDGLIGLNLAGTINTWNPGAQKIYGHEASAVVFKDVTMLCGESARDVKALVHEVRTGRKAKKLECMHVDKTGKPMQVGLTMSPVLDAAGRVIALAMTVRNLSERKASDAHTEGLNTELQKTSQKLRDLEAKLQEIKENPPVPLPVVPAPAAKPQAPAIKSEFLSKIGREFRIPMDSIMGLSEIVGKNAALSRQEREYMNIIRESGYSILNVLDDMVDFTKVETGEISIERNSINLIPLLEGVAQSVSAKAAKKRVSITSFVSPEIPSALFGDQAKLEKILRKLLETVVARVERGGVIIRAVPDDMIDTACKVRFVIEDVGRGLSHIVRSESKKHAQDMHDKVFEDSKLGLSVTKHFVELMGGKLGGDQVGTGHSGAVWAIIPFDKVPNTEVVPAEPAFAGRKVLAVDGPTGAARIVQAYSADWGLKSEWVVTADEALSVLTGNASANTPFDMVVVENIAFGMSGLGLVETIKSTSDLRGLDIVYYSPFLPATEQLALEQLGVTSIISGALRESLLRSLLAEIARKRPVVSQVQARTPLILVAEGDESNRRATTAQLQSFGLKARVVNSAGEAIEAADRNSYALIWMDCVLPDMDGWTAARAIRRLEVSSGRRTPIIGVAWAHQGADPERCRDAGMDEVAVRPIDGDRMEHILRRWIPAHLLKSQPQEAEKSTIPAEAGATKVKEEPSPPDPATLRAEAERKAAAEAAAAKAKEEARSRIAAVALAAKAKEDARYAAAEEESVARRKREDEIRKEVLRREEEVRKEFQQKEEAEAELKLREQELRSDLQRRDEELAKSKEAGKQEPTRADDSAKTASRNEEAAHSRKERHRHEKPEAQPVQAHVEHKETEPNGTGEQTGETIPSPEEMMQLDPQQLQNLTEQVIWGSAAGKTGANGAADEAQAKAAPELRVRKDDADVPVAASVPEPVAAQKPTPAPAPPPQKPDKRVLLNLLQATESVAASERVPKTPVIDINNATIMEAVSPMVKPTPAPQVAPPVAEPAASVAPALPEAPADEVLHAAPATEVPSTAPVAEVPPAAPATEVPPAAPAAEVPPAAPEPLMSPGPRLYQSDLPTTLPTELPPGTEALAAELESRIEEMVNYNESKLSMFNQAKASARQEFEQYLKRAKEVQKETQNMLDQVSALAEKKAEEDAVEAVITESASAQVQETPTAAPETPADTTTAPEPVTAAEQTFAAVPQSVPSIMELAAQRRPNGEAALEIIQALAEDPFDDFAAENEQKTVESPQTAQSETSPQIEQAQSETVFNTQGANGAELQKEIDAAFAALLKPGADLQEQHVTAETQSKQIDMFEAEAKIAAEELAQSVSGSHPRVVPQVQMNKPTAAQLAADVLQPTNESTASQATVSAASSPPRPLPDLPAVSLPANTVPVELPQPTEAPAAPQSAAEPAPPPGNLEVEPRAEQRAKVHENFWDVPAAPTAAGKDFGSDDGGNGTQSAASTDIDLDRLQKICGDGGMCVILNEFVVTAQRLIDDLELAIMRKDADGRKAYAIDLSNSCEAVGALKLCEMAVQIQELDDNNWKGARAIVKQIKSSYDQLTVLIEPHLREK